MGLNVISSHFVFLLFFLIMHELFRLYSLCVLNAWSICATVSWTLNLEINWKVVLRFGNHWEYPLQCNTKDGLHCNGCIKQLHLTRVHPPWKLEKQYHARGPMNFNTREIGLNESYLCKVIGWTCIINDLWLRIQIVELMSSIPR